MVLCQIFITEPIPINLLIPIGVYGRKKVKIVKIDNVYTTNADRVIQLQSNILRVPYGNVPYLTFCTNPTHQVSNISDSMVFDANLNGNLDLSIINTATGIPPSGFTSFMMLLDITDFE